MQEIKSQYTIVIVTHNMQQAARVSDRTAFFTTEVEPRERPTHRRAGRVQPDRQDLLQPRRRAHRAVRDREVRMTANDLRPNFHQELEELRNEVARLGAYVVELIPRVTDILLQQDLEGADYVLRGDADIDARSIDDRGAGAAAAGAAGARRQRPAPDRVGAQAGARDRTLRRPVLQHLQGGAPDLRARARPEAARR